MTSIGISNYFDSNLFSAVHVGSSFDKEGSLDELRSTCNTLKAGCREFHLIEQLIGSIASERFIALSNWIRLYYQKFNQLSQTELESRYAQISQKFDPNSSEDVSRIADVEQKMQAFCELRNQLITEANKELCADLIAHSIIESPLVQNLAASEFMNAMWVVPCVQVLIQACSDKDLEGSYRTIFRIMALIIDHLEKKFPKAGSVKQKENMDVKILMSLMFHHATHSELYQNIIRSNASEPIGDRLDGYRKEFCSNDFYTLLSSWSGKKLTLKVLYCVFRNVIDGMIASINQGIDKESECQFSVLDKIDMFKANLETHCRGALLKANLETIPDLEPLPEVCRKATSLNFGSMFSK
jgi:hypothetical protein